MTCKTLTFPEYLSHARDLPDWLVAKSAEESVGHFHFEALRSYVQVVQASQIVLLRLSDTSTGLHPPSNTKLDKHIVKPCICLSLLTKTETKLNLLTQNWRDTSWNATKRKICQQLKTGTRTKKERTSRKDNPNISSFQESHNRLQAQARELAGRNGKLFRTETRTS